MIRALSFDLDDTLWPIAPTIEHAERRLQDWLSAEVPAIAPLWPVARMRALRDEVAQSHPEIAHDYREQRRRSLRIVLAAEIDRERLVEHAYDTFYAARNEVTLYADAGEVLPHLARRFRLASLSNGNADLQRIGLAHHFEQRISARDVGVMKPDPQIFSHLCRQLELDASEIAHIGDDPDLDVIGAKRAGMFAIWLNRDGNAWPHAVPPDLEINDLHGLRTWLEALPDAAPME
jgi:FMN hydrolase / 5-amino-6-(5-phospho-D-ribitylamino)uracil phosphatase